MEEKTKALSIKIYGEPILRQTALKVERIDKETISVIEKMMDTMHINEGIGLAAPQVGISKQIIVADVDEKAIKLINPTIIEKEGGEKAQEGCLSVPEIYIGVKRPFYVKIKGLNEKGEPVTIEAEGLLARVLQHEIDHLNGILIVDYASPIRKVSVKKQLKNIGRL